jgi:phosphoadenosine phosphosulfate reductase
MQDQVVNRYARPEAMRNLEELSAEGVLAHAIELHHPRLVLACSFQKEDSVLIHMLTSLQPRARVFTIDTGELFPETYALWQRMEERYRLHVEVADAASLGGPWTADSCCGTRKVAALNHALANADAWVTGLRREQSPGRAATPKAAWDDVHGVWKFSPLADWTEENVWSYVFDHELPYNRLHDAGYASIGCRPCTRPGAAREGRWPGQERSECGLHT